MCNSVVVVAVVLVVVVVVVTLGRADVVVIHGDRGATNPYVVVVVGLQPKMMDDTITKRRIPMMMIRNQSK
jgi:hypothetical protein